MKLCHISHIVLWVLGLLVSSQSIASVAATAVQGNWLFHYGDNLNRSDPDFDDKHWPSIDVPGAVYQVANQDIKGWYRLHFDMHKLEHETLAILFESIRHSDETWFNGVLIGATGKMEEPWQFAHTVPQGLTRVYKIPQGLLRVRDNVLAVKVKIGFGSAWGAMFPGGSGINGRVFIDDFGTLEKQRQIALIKTSQIYKNYISAFMFSASGSLL